MQDLREMKIKLIQKLNELRQTEQCASMLSLIEIMIVEIRINNDICDTDNFKKNQGAISQLKQLYQYIEMGMPKAPEKKIINPYEQQ